MSTSLAPQPRPFVVVTGLSGAGKASILHILEDLGYETVDNPPLAILPSLVEDGTLPLAAGIDTRTRGFDAEQVGRVLHDLRRRPRTRSHRARTICRTCFFP